ncbi:MULTISPECIES: MFS transporter small subunit [Nocardioides]|nr:MULTISPECIES: hypothetical protein [Nocardioides]
MNAEHHVDHTARITASWALVGIPLGYGLFNAIKAAAQLFA